MRNKKVVRESKARFFYKERTKSSIWFNKVFFVFFIFISCIILDTQFFKKEKKDKPIYELKNLK